MFRQEVLLSTLIYVIYSQLANGLLECTCSKWQVCQTNFYSQMNDYSWGSASCHLVEWKNPWELQRASNHTGMTGHGPLTAHCYNLTNSANQCSNDFLLFTVAYQRIPVATDLLDASWDFGVYLFAKRCRTMLLSHNAQLYSLFLFSSEPWAQSSFMN